MDEKPYQRLGEVMDNLNTHALSSFYPKFT